MSKVAVQVTREFNRNLEGQMIVGHPEHPDIKGRFMLLSATAAASLVGDDVAKEIPRRTYDAAMREAEGEDADGDGPVAGTRETNRGQDAGDVRVRTTEAVDGSRNTNAGVDRRTRAKPTMSNAMLDGLADELGVDVSRARSRAEKVRLINGTAGSKPQETDVERAGATGNLSAGSTNHDPRSSPHKGTNRAGSVDDNQIGRTPMTGLETGDDAAPRGGGGAGGE